MQINVNHIPEKGYSETFTREASFFRELRLLEETEEYQFTAPVTTMLSIAVTIDKRIEILGHVKTIVKMPCARCLDPFKCKIETDFKLLYSDIQSDFHNTDESLTEEGYEVLPNEIETEFYSGDIITVTDAVQEQVIMALPPQALCDEACKGLCTKCGVNLNRSECACETESGHPAFAALKALKK